MLESVNSQEVNSLVCTSRTQPASGNRWRESFQNFELRSKTSQLATLCYITILDVDDGFSDFTPVCREHTLPLADPPSRAYAAISVRTLIGPVIEVHLVQLLGNHGPEIKIQFQNNPDRTSWVLIFRGENRFVNELHIPDPGHNLTSSELLSEQAIAKEAELCSTELEQSSFGETRVKLSRSPSDTMNYTYEGRKWKTNGLSIIERKIISSTDLIIGHENGAHLWSRRARNWRNSSLVR